jgi:hypothetical protein
MLITKGPNAGLTVYNVTVVPMVPVAGTSTDCLLKSANGYNSGNGVRALQNALAFTDYDLKASNPKWKYAGILVGSGALQANNWGIDGSFGSKTYNALVAYQTDKSTAGGADGEYGNNTRDQMYFGEGYIRDSGSPPLLDNYKVTLRIGSSATPVVTVYAFSYS